MQPDFQAFIAGTALFGETEAIKRGSRRRTSYPVRSFDELPQGDDPFAGMRGPRPDYGQSDWASQAECDGGKFSFSLLLYVRLLLKMCASTMNPQKIHGTMTYMYTYSVDVRL